MADLAASTQGTALLAKVDKRAQGPQHVLSMADLSGHLGALISQALTMKQASVKGKLQPLLAGKAVLSLYERNSTRTRVSFDVGVQRLGGISTVLDKTSSQLARGETLGDTAAVLSRYADAIVYRATSHGHATELARHATVPVVNALTDREHPCQVLADLTTLAEHKGTGLEGLQGDTLAYVGDGNNMCHSYLLGAALAGMHVHVAAPLGYQPDPAIVQQARDMASAYGTEVQVTEDPARAVDGAHAVATDTWTSMGDEAEADKREAAFQGYTVDHALMQQAHPEAVFLHCLPGHWGHEASYEVAHGPQSLIRDQAENRMWSQMALLAHLL
ncbi:MAG: ornithine carbamoyltransferase [Candidatus Thermoplasmatota archaeon]|nr:ornithine carbamoyltransferase [Candidatus Thermoplasmatota archaeon]